VRGIVRRRGYQTDEERWRAHLGGDDLDEPAEVL